MIKPTLSIVVEGSLPNALKKVDLEHLSRAIVDNTLLKKEAVVGVKFVTEAEARKLNKKYAGHDYPTDVLSFPYQPSSTNDSMGDIVICTSIAKKQAAESGQTVASELILLIAHGVLHLFKYDHQTPQDAASMDWLQGAIMKALKYNYRDFKWSH